MQTNLSMREVILDCKIKSKISSAQLKWLMSGLKQAGGKLPLFDDHGKRIPERTIRTCIKKGWAEPWFSNPIKPDWLVCKLTENGYAIIKSNSELSEAV